MVFYTGIFLLQIILNALFVQNLCLTNLEFFYLVFLQFNPETTAFIASELVKSQGVANKLHCDKRRKQWMTYKPVCSTIQD